MQNRKLNAWSKYYGSNSQVVSLADKATSSEESKVAQQVHNEFIALKFKALTKMQLPTNHMSEPNRASRFEYSAVARVTLFSSKNGFFGRTYTSQQIALDANSLAPVGDMSEYCSFYSKFKDIDLQAVIEFVLICKEKSAQAADQSNQNISRVQNSQEEEKKDSQEESK